MLHVLVHGTTSTTGGHVQWTADATLVLRQLPPDDAADRLARQARAHGVVGMVRTGLELLEDYVGSGAVAPWLARLRGTPPARLERLATPRNGTARFRRRVAGGAAVLARFGGGTTGVVASARALVRSTQDLALVRSRAFTLVYTALGRPPALARFWRWRHGSFVRTPLAAPPYVLGRWLDFTDPATADRYAGPGWSWVDERGVASYGGEARVVLDAHAEADCELVLVARARRRRQQGRGGRERRARRYAAPPGVRRCHHRTHAGGARTIRRCAPVEIAFRAAGTNLVRRHRVLVTLRALQLAPARGLVPEAPARLEVAS